MVISNYIRKHKVLQIGVPLPTQICSEVIVDDPKGFLQVVLQNGCYISAISWWERVAIDTKPEIGYGGSRDPIEPNRFYYAETDMEDHFSAFTSEYDYLSYMSRIWQSNPNIALYPAFEVSKK